MIKEKGELTARRNEGRLSFLAGGLILKKRNSQRFDGLLTC